jgi:hypothetical protein
LKNYFLTRPLLNGAGEFAVSRTNNVPELPFATVSESEISDAVMSIKLDAACVDGIHLSLIKLLLPVVVPFSTEFPEKLKIFVVLPVPKVTYSYIQYGILVCLSKVFEVLMARQMGRHIRCKNC